MFVLDAKKEGNCFKHLFNKHIYFSFDEFECDLVVSDT